MRPGNRIDTGRIASTCRIDLESTCGLARVTRIDGHDHTLASIFFGCLIDEIRVFNRRRVDRNLICACAQDLLKILNRADAAADRNRDKNLPAGAAYHIRNGIPVFVRRGDVQKYNLVCACFGIGLGQLDRVACVAQADKVDTLDHASVLDIQAGNDTFCQHIILPP